MADLDEGFCNEMVKFDKLSTKVVGHAPTCMYQRMGERGAVQTAIDLVKRPEASGFADLLLTTPQRQDLSIE